MHSVWKSLKKSHSTLRAERAMYLCMLSGKKFIKNVAKKGQFWECFRKPEACGQTVLPDRSVGQKLVEKSK